VKYFELIKKYKKKISENDLQRIIFFLSKKIKEKDSLIKYFNKDIDFSIKKFEKILNDIVDKKKPIELFEKKVNFLGLDFKIQKGLLIPRVETELLTEKAIHEIKQCKWIDEIYDLCCGTGVIGITLKKKFKDIDVIGVDINKNAIALAIDNAKINKVYVKFIKGDFYKSLKEKTNCIIMNPPYVDKISDLKMLKYENKKNFINSANDTDFYKKIIDNYKKIFTNKFLFICEIGYNQKKKLQKIIKNNKLSKYTKFYKDYSDHDRIMVIKKTI